MAFVAALRDVDRSVYTHPEELDALLERLSDEARELARTLLAHPPSEPDLLWDGGEDGWEEFLYIPVVMAPTPKMAKRIVRDKKLLELVGPGEPGFTYTCERRTHLSPATYYEGDDAWFYLHCGSRSDGAVEFWVVELVERRFSLRRRLSYLRRGLSTYRWHRAQGETRRFASAPLRRQLTPGIYYSTRFRLKQWKRRRAQRAAA